MRDALTNFGSIAVTSSGSAASANIVNMTAPGKTEVTPKDCRLVVYPKTTAAGAFTFEIKGSDSVSGEGNAVALSSPAVVGEVKVNAPKVGVTQKFPFPLEVKNKYYQVFGSGASTANFEVWFEFGA